MSGSKEGRFDWRLLNLSAIGQKSELLACASWERERELKVGERYRLQL